MKKECILYALVFILSTSCKDELLPEQTYDQSHPQEPVLSHEKLDSVLNEMETVPYSQLPDEYVSYCELSGRFKANYAGKTFYKVEGDQMYRYIAGKHRIRDLLPKDIFYQQVLLGKSDVQYFMMDKRIIHKLLDLILTLKDRAYDYHALEVYYGFRHPRYNRDIGGASLSMHMKGIAIDVRVGDIDQDGDKDKDDKQVVLDILDKELIGNHGGIGKYPGTQCVHMDIRGSRARWDSF